jgi:hypothetical protein
MLSQRDFAACPSVVPVENLQLLGKDRDDDIRIEQDPTTHRDSLAHILFDGLGNLRQVFLRDGPSEPT